MASNNSRPVIIVTGANSGLGFGICHRLIIQLSSASQEFASKCDGLTLILACRNKQRAEVARAKLCDIANEQLIRAKRSPDYNGHAEIFLKNLHLVVHTIDLADIQSIFRFADEIDQTYPYVSHLICNAGVVCFTRINWPLAIYQLLTDFVGAVTTPTYFAQSAGNLSQDGLGWTWQCNVFGHYVLFRALEPKMTKCPDARVVWISSHEASSESYDPKDWQLVQSERSYQCSKYQMNMISLCLDREAVRDQLHGTSTVRHITIYPGVAGTSIASAMLGTFQMLCMFASFYIARFLGSLNHPIDIFKAAISSVYASLTPLTLLPCVNGAANSTDTKESIEGGTVYVSKTNWRGHEFVGTTKLVVSQEEITQTKELLQNCDRLLKTLCDAQGRASPSG